MATPSEKFYESLLVTSNLIFIWPIVEAVLAGDYYVAIMLTFTMIASTFYHICGLIQSCSNQFGVTPRQMDFIFATNVICLTALYWSGLTNLRRIGYSSSKYAWALTASLVLFVVCITSVLYGNFDSYVYMAVILASIGMLFIRFIVFAPEDTSDDLAVRGVYRIEYFIMTGLLGIIGILLFFADDWISFPAYDETHPYWHILIGATIGLAIRGVRYRDQYDALRQRNALQKYKAIHRGDVNNTGSIYSIFGPRYTKDVSGGDDDLFV